MTKHRVATAFPIAIASFVTFDVYKWQRHVKRLNYAMVATRLKCNSHTDVIKNKNKRNISDNKVGNQKLSCGT